MEHEVSYGFTRKSVSNPRTSSIREGKEMRDNILEEPILRKKDHGRGPRWWKKASYKGYTFPHRIECTTTTLSVTLMKKWHLNSSFTASSSFHHLQQNSDGTSDLRKALRHIGGGLWCKEEGYIREGEPPSYGDDSLRI